MLEENPRLLWRVALGLLPVWGGVACASYLWIRSWPVIAESIRLPEVKNRGTVEARVEETSIGAYDCIWKRPLRQELVVRKPAKPPRPVPQDRAIGLALVGTAVEGRESYAFLTGKARRLVVAKVGSVIGSFVVVAVHPDRVLLERDGVTTTLSLPESMRQIVRASGIPEPQSQETPVLPGPLARAEFKPPTRQIVPIDLMCSAEEFLRGVRLVPCIGISGAQVGLRIDSISLHGSLSRSGLAAGDVIVRIDGADLTRISDMDRLCASLEDGKDHKWNVRRQDVGLEVRIIGKRENHDELP